MLKRVGNPALVCFYYYYYCIIIFSYTDLFLLLKAEPISSVLFKQNVVLLPFESKPRTYPVLRCDQQQANKKQYYIVCYEFQVTTYTNIFSSGRFSKDSFEL